MLEWYLNNLDYIKVEVTLINQCRILVETTPVPTSTDVIYIYECSRKTPTTLQQDQIDHYFPLLHKLFQEHIKMLSE